MATLLVYLWIILYHSAPLWKKIGALFDARTCARIDAACARHLSLAIVELFKKAAMDQTRSPCGCCQHHGAHHHLIGAAGVRHSGLLWKFEANRGACQRPNALLVTARAIGSHEVLCMQTQCIGSFQQGQVTAGSHEVLKEIEIRVMVPGGS